ncbi:MAG: hypothetical protein KDJ90_11945 [Nitratireductor sp.]|nr:hypothetical protein [Nitratireductor sp.]
MKTIADAKLPSIGASRIETIAIGAAQDTKTAALAPRLTCESFSPCIRHRPIENHAALEELKNPEPVLPLPP